MRSESLLLEFEEVFLGIAHGARGVFALVRFNEGRGLFLEEGEIALFGVLES